MITGNAQSRMWSFIVGFLGGFLLLDLFSLWINFILQRSSKRPEMVHTDDDDDHHQQDHSPTMWYSNQRYSRHTIRIKLPSPRPLLAEEEASISDHRSRKKVWEKFLSRAFFYVVCVLCKVARQGRMIVVVLSPRREECVQNGRSVKPLNAFSIHWSCTCDRTLYGLLPPTWRR